MPYRTLNIDEAARYLHLDLTVVMDLVKKGEIPFEMQGCRVTFRRKELEAWASQRILGLPAKRLADYHRTTSAKAHDLSRRHAIISELLAADRIEPNLRSQTRSSVLRDMVALAERTGMLCDPADLVSSLGEREKLCSTAIEHGIALLHPRNHDPFMFTDSFIALGRSIRSIHYGAPDGKPTDLFFLMCCQDDRIHLHVLARICSLCLHTDMLGELREVEDARAMMSAVVKAEQAVIRSL